MQKRTTHILFIILVAVVAAIIAGCSSSDSYIPPAPTLDKESRRATAEARPTIDVVANQAAAPIRATERALERLSVLVVRYDERIARDINRSGTPELSSDDWLDDCCDEITEDFLDELLEIEDQSQKLTAIYEEAADEAKLQIIQQVQTPLANINALYAVFAALPTSNGFASILDDISLELTAFSEAFAGLG